MYFMRAIIFHTGRFNLPANCGFFHIDRVIDLLIQPADVKCMANCPEMREVSQILTDAFTAAFSAPPKFLRADIPESALFPHTPSTSLHRAVIALCVGAKNQLLRHTWNHVHMQLPHLDVLDKMDLATTDPTVIARFTREHAYPAAADLKETLRSCLGAL